MLWGRSEWMTTSAEVGTSSGEDIARGRRSKNGSEEAAENCHSESLGKQVAHQS